MNIANDCVGCIINQSAKVANAIEADNNNKGVDIVEAANENIDSGGSGHEKNLFYYGNVDNYNDAGVSNISTRGETMTLEVE